MKGKTQKRLVVLIIIATVLISIFYFQDFLINRLNPQSETFFSTIQSDEIKEITLYDDANIVFMYKKNNDWYVRQNEKEYKADKARIYELLTSIKELNKNDVISKNKKNRSTFQIGKRKITFKTSKSSHTIYIGKSVDMKNYFTIDNDNYIYTAEGLENTLIPLDYRDLSLHLIDDINSLSKVVLSFDNQRLELNQKNSRWFIDNIEIKKDRIDFFINDLQTLKSDTLYEKETINGHEQAMKIEIKEGKNVRVAEIFSYDQEYYYAKISNSNYIYQIRAAYVQSLKKIKTDFID